MVAARVFTLAGWGRLKCRRLAVKACISKQPRDSSNSGWVTLSCVSKAQAWEGCCFETLTALRVCGLVKSDFTVWDALAIFPGLVWAWMIVCFWSPIRVSPQYAAGGWLAVVWPKQRGGKAFVLYVGSRICLFSLFLQPPFDKSS